MAGKNIVWMDPFNPEEEKIGTYLQRVELFFIANEIAPDKWVPVFLTLIGGKVYSLLADLLAPQAPCTKSFAQLSQVLKDHYEPKKVIVVNCFYFHRCFQGPDESIADFVAGLPKMAIDCKFPAEFLNDALRDQFVSRLGNEAIQSHLLSEAELTFA